MVNQNRPQASTANTARSLHTTIRQLKRNRKWHIGSKKRNKTLQIEIRLRKKMRDTGILFSITNIYTENSTLLTKQHRRHH